MKPLVLYCKSYRTDLKRVLRLAESVAKFNQDELPFYVSVPDSDFDLFLHQLQHLPVILLRDETIVQASPRLDPLEVNNMPGHLSQQVVKSEFWRLGLSEAYVCLDSDAIFIRSFGLSDFMAPDGAPYTMMDEAHDLLEGALRQKRERVLHDFTREAEQVQVLFNRVGRRYSFGPFPLVWHRAVWQSLDELYLQPNQMNFSDAITLAPIESRWYGEALLAFQAVALRPCQALFKVYHYAWQYDQDVRRGINETSLAQLYCGVIFQSAWERDMDWPAEGGSALSKITRRIRRRLGRV